MNYFKYACTIITFFLISTLLCAHPVVQWNNQINSTRGEFVRVDSTGNVFIGGRVDHSQTSYSIFLAKYDSAGNQLWYIEPNFGGVCSMTNMILDVSSNIYLSGYAEIYTDPSTTNCATLCAKIDSAGNIIWFDKYRRGSLTTYNGGID